MVSERIDDASLPQTVGLIRDGEHLARSGGDSAGLGSVGVIDVQRDANGRASDTLRTRCPELGRLRRHPDALPVDQQEGDLRPVRRNHPLPLFRGTESLCIERDCGIDVSDREKGIDLGHSPTLPDHGQADSVDARACASAPRRWVTSRSRGIISDVALLVPSAPSTRVSPAERDSVAVRLRDACVEDRLSLQTFARRLDLLYAARTDAELRALVDDLPRTRTFERRFARLARSTAAWVTVWTDAWERARAPRLSLPREGAMVLGRSRDCAGLIGHPTVSRRHARLVCTPSGWTLRDLDSCNGTYVNGVRIAGVTPVKPGDEVWFGSTRFLLVLGRRSRRLGRHS